MVYMRTSDTTPSTTVRFGLKLPYGVMLGWHFSPDFCKKQHKNDLRVFLFSNYFHCIFFRRKRNLGPMAIFTEILVKNDIKSPCLPISNHGRMVGQTIGRSECRTVGRLEGVMLGCNKKVTC